MEEDTGYNLLTAGWLAGWLIDSLTWLLVASHSSSPCRMYVRTAACLSVHSPRRDREWGGWMDGWMDLFFPILLIVILHPSWTSYGFFSSFFTSFLLYPLLLFYEEGRSTNWDRVGFKFRMKESSSRKGGSSSGIMHQPTNQPIVYSIDRSVYYAVFGFQTRSSRRKSTNKEDWKYTGKYRQADNVM